MKNIVLGYHFYKGAYLDYLAEVLDAHRKTIINIPSVNSRVSAARGKFTEVAEIMHLIGEEVEHSYNNGILNI